MPTAFVRVHEGAVQSFLLPGQPVDELIHNTAQHARALGREHIKDRTGALAASLQVNRPTRTGPLTNSSLVVALSKHALYVHEGTGMIFPKSGRMLTIPVNKQGPTGAGNPSGGTLRKAWRSGGLTAFPDGKPYFTRRYIHGQKANPFLQKGLAEAMALVRR
jgi:hypothetical protein